MDYIPGEVRTLLKEQGYTTDPDQVIRALNSLSGELGEAYLMVLDGSLIIYSRQIGKSFSDLRLPLSGISGVTLVEDRPFAYLSFTSDSIDYSLKFSGLDLNSLAMFRDTLTPDGTGQSATETPTAVDHSPPEDAPVELSPVIGFCAAVYAMIQADSSIDDDELELLNRLIDHPPTVLKGLDALRRLGTVELFTRLNTLMDNNQKLCMVANLVEMAMVDGLVRGKERQLLSQVREAIGVEKENFDAIFEVLMIKNNRSVFEITE